MATIWYDKDADISRLKGRTVAIIGYGSQGHAHALNLRDSGVSVVVGLHATSKSAAKAKADGLTVLSVDEAAKRADIVMILTPDTGQKKLYDESIAPHLKAGKTLMFAHGFNIRFGQIVAARRRGRVDDRAEGARPPRARAVPGRRGHARAPRGRAERERPRPRGRARLRAGARLDARRACSRRRSPRRRRRISSASRPSSAAARPRS